MVARIGGGRRAETPSREALIVLAVLTAINFLNYLDRQILSAILDPIADTFDLSDAQAGWLASMFMIVYTLFAPLCGRVGDRWNRQRITAIAVALWSLATALGGLARSYEELLLTRALVGIGEAGYAIVAPSVIADLFRPEERGRRLAIFYLAIPMGSALGYLLGGLVAETHGWRTAFFVAGGPGLLFALVAATLPEPERGAMDDTPPPPEVDVWSAFGQVLGNRSWRFNSIGMTLMTFTMGGLAVWMPTFLIRKHGMGVGEASMKFGALTVVAGLLATLLGGYVGDRIERRGPGGYFRVSGVGLILGAPFVGLMPYLTHEGLVFACAFMGEFFLFLNTGPLNAALVACVPANLRATAVALNILVIHMLGDAVSPALMGRISDATDIAFAVSITAIPVLAGGIVLLVGAERLRRFSSAHRLRA